ncbi:hypothetical protein NECAME_08108 [Necator americanus]|uniref:Uncharacterized protein n=1 Tax=Necator americanus TaxID=51031 RepID=W2TKN1_NECAM|nr:hypothetical protein NECAME_08108 [Necator americanus]ETN82179.1 hypothetical protein NECAME_08108 [Necator americanus]
MPRSQTLCRRLRSGARSNRQSCVAGGKKKGEEKSTTIADQVTDILNGVSHNHSGNESVIERNTSATHESQNSTKATARSCVTMLTVAVPLTFFFIF